MTNRNKIRKTLDCKSSDRPYLHRDFHGALCYAIKYLDDNYGFDATRRYFEGVGETCFAPLSRKLRDQGLSALEEHWRTVFSKEAGEFSIAYDGDVLVLTVTQCPAIKHLKTTGQLFTDRYCESTVATNRAICRAAGYDSSCEYEPGQGRCAQRFWRKGSEV